MIKAILTSLRLRTLPLSLSGIVFGIFAAAAATDVSPVTAVLLILTASLLQILSNLSNELGDTLSGTDGDDRQGIHYSLQDGAISIPQMRKLIAAVVILCCLSGLAMIWSAFGTVPALKPALFLLLGAAAIWAAMHYTLGKNPYGYKGYGDIFVFIFFGLATTLGGCYICGEGAGLANAILPAISIGCLSVGVLNVNNIRDMKTDAATRTTVALKMGEKRAKTYQTALVTAGWAFMILNMAVLGKSWRSWLFLATLPLFALHLKGVWARKDRELDPMLPLLVLSTFAFSLLAGIGLL